MTRRSSADPCSKSTSTHTTGRHRRTHALSTQSLHVCMLKYRHRHIFACISAGRHMLQCRHTCYTGMHTRVQMHIYAYTCAHVQRHSQHIREHMHTQTLTTHKWLPGRHIPHKHVHTHGHHTGLKAPPVQHEAISHHLRNERSPGRHPRFPCTGKA